MPEPATGVTGSRRARRRAWHRRFGASLRHSLRLRLIALFLLFALVMSVVFLGGMQRAFSSGWREALRPLVADYVDRLVAEIGTPPDLRRAQALSERLPIAIRISGPRVNWRSHDADTAADADGAAPDGRPGSRSFASSRQGGGPGFAPLLARDTADGHRIAFSLAGLAAWQSRPQRIGWITLAALLLLTAAAYRLIRRLLRPLDDIRAGAERFGTGDFARPIPVRRADELGDLARRINASAAELHRMLEAKRALLLAISHELRSPLTRARLNTELLPCSPETGRPRAALLRDIAEMRGLIDALLEGERLASPHAALQRTPTDVGALAGQVIDELTRERAAAQQPGAPAPVAAPPPVASLRVEGELPPCRLDAARIRVLLRNLLDNALRHGGAATAQPPGVTLRFEQAAAGAEHDDALVLNVRDRGPGVDAAVLPHLTEPFFRADAARQRATGGVGLGLYLCRLIVEAHGGTLTVRNAAPGLDWTVRLPLPQAADRR